MTGEKRNNLPLDIYVQRWQEDPRPEFEEKILRLLESCVVAIASLYAGPAWPLEDLIQEGKIGAILALRKFSTEREATFKTFARTRILGAIRHYMREENGAISEPHWLSEARVRVRNAKSRLQDISGQEPDLEALCRETYLTEEELSVVEMAERQRMLLSLDDPEQGEAWIDLSTGRDSPESEASLNRIWLESVLKDLPRSCREVIRLRFWEGLSVEETALVMDRSHAAIRSIQSRAFLGLRGRLHEYD